MPTAPYARSLGIPDAQLDWWWSACRFIILSARYYRCMAAQVTMGSPQLGRCRARSADPIRDWPARTGAAGA
jgi:hypothetical protein